MIKQHFVKNGFTILEMSLILMAVGFLVGTYLSFYRPDNTAQATIQTQLKIDRVLNAVSNFAMHSDNRRLPCPASPTEGNVSNFGREATGCNTGAATPAYGIIPYKALGLSQEDAMDSFGYYMTYAVLRDATTATAGRADQLGPPNTSHFCGSLISPLIVNNNGVNEQAFVAVISHGVDGRGSYNVTAGTRFNAGGLGAAEANNANTDNNLIITTYNPNNVDPTNIANRNANFFFDDMVGYMTRRGVIDRVSTLGCY